MFWSRRRQRDRKQFYFFLCWHCPSQFSVIFLDLSPTVDVSSPFWHPNSKYLHFSFLYMCNKLSFAYRRLFLPCACHVFASLQPIQLRAEISASEAAAIVNRLRKLLCLFVIFLNEKLQGIMKLFARLSRLKWRQSAFFTEHRVKVCHWFIDIRVI